MKRRQSGWELFATAGLIAVAIMLFSYGTIFAGTATHTVSHFAALNLFMAS